MLLVLKFCKSHQRTGSFTRTFELVLLALDGRLNWYNIATCFQTEPSEEKFKNYTVGKFAHGPKSYIDVLITITLLVAFESFQNKNFRFLELVYHTSLLIREVLKRLALVNHFKLTKNYYHWRTSCFVSSHGPNCSLVFLLVYSFQNWYTYLDGCEAGYSLQYCIST